MLWGFMCYVSSRPSMRTHSCSGWPHSKKDKIPCVFPLPWFKPKLFYYFLLYLLNKRLNLKLCNLNLVPS